MRQAVLDSVLDRDLGIDSLARMELLLRLERQFGVRVPEDILMEAETARDLLLAIESGETRGLVLPERHRATAIATAEAAAPDDAATLLEALEFHLERHADRPHIRHLTATGTEESLTYAELWAGCQAIAGGLRERNVRQGQTVAIMLPTGLDFFHTFLGIILAGATPVPIYPPARRSQIEEHLRRQARILRNAEARMLVTTAEASVFGRMIQAQVETIASVISTAELSVAGGKALRPRLRGETVALLQYTSGSTGDPKGVILTHANLLSNVRGLGQVFDVTSNDVIVSWLPLYHDMGLIGAWLGSLYHAAPLVVLSPLSFLARPERWLWAIHRFRGTLSAAPNFAYELCVHKIADADIQGLDLSTWRMAGNGAEPVRASTIEKFVERFESHGFDRRAIAPMYGLAENSVALTVSPPGREVRIERVDRYAYGRTGYAAITTAEVPSVARFVSCGPPLPGHEVRIVDAAGRELGDRQEGRLQFRGPSATKAYHRNPEKSAELFDGDWLNAGDVGYVDRGEVFVTGRIKDIIVRAGRNLYPEEIENEVGNLPGVRKGRVAVFGAKDPRAGTEELVVVAETRERNLKLRIELERQIHALVTTLTEIPPEHVILARPGTVLKTANGKVRRSACQQVYEAGRLERPPPPLWQQIAGVLLASVGPELRRWRLATAAFLYAIRFQLTYRAMAPFAWLLIALVPGRSRRRLLFRWATSLFVRLLDIVPAVEGLDRLPLDEPYVLVANHGSFLDGLVLAAILPGDYTFTVKREIAETPIAGTFLRRIGVAFIERLDISSGVADARSLVQQLTTGEPLVVFPEGTFDRRPGLRLFQMGAFVTAAQAGVPIVPVAIQGTRAILRGDAWFARRGRIGVTFSPAIRPTGDDWKAALALRDEARMAILRNCGEPDLVDEPTALRLRASATRARQGPG
ncbi:MAG: AMP-binding protein [Hyphomicrobiales bacterium]|nr:AMP-binding protein [Hyphomicrobiales bacterium]